VVEVQVDMTGKEVLLDLLQNLAEWIHYVLGGMSRDALQWQPDEEANSIAVTVWHISRSLDVLKARLLENQSSEAELWCQCGWTAQTGYDPSGIGWGGLGTLGQYTRSEVEAVPALSAEELLVYFDQTKGALEESLSKMPDDVLHRPPLGWPQGASGHGPGTAYECIRNILMDAREHLGEIKALKAMWERRIRAS